METSVIADEIERMLTPKVGSFWLSKRTAMKLAVVGVVDSLIHTACRCTTLDGKRFDLGQTWTIGDFHEWHREL